MSEYALPVQNLVQEWDKRDKPSVDTDWSNVLERNPQLQSSSKQQRSGATPQLILLSSELTTSYSSGSGTRRAREETEEIEEGIFPQGQAS